MPVTPTYPGVYIEEVSSGVRTIVGVATSITAFIGRAARGPTNEPIRIANFGDFERMFGGIEINSPMTYAVHQFFLNGGADAVVVRVANVGDNGDAVKASEEVNGLPIRAKGEGKWGNEIRVRVNYQTRDPNNDELFNLFVNDATTGLTESFRNLSVDKDDSRYYPTVLAEESMLIELTPGDDPPAERPGQHADLDPATDNPFDKDKGQYYTKLENGNDGGDIDGVDVIGSRLEKTGLYALEKADLFNLLCIPPLSRSGGGDVPPNVYGEAAKYCAERRAFLIVDPPQDVTTVAGAEALTNGDLLDQIGAHRKNAAMYFPYLRAPDVKKENRLQSFAPSGTVAGIMARTDVQRGVWKSPAGITAALVGINGFTVKLTDPENGRLNVLGINCLRSFPVIGNVVWGARTLEGADRLSSEWKYLAIRRFTLFLEESLYRGTGWVVFEPNDHPLWAEIRLNVGAFMQTLFRQGAFQGRSPREAYFVRCGEDTTTQADIDRGIVNIEVGFAPLKPAEFVIIKIQQIAGKLDN